MTDHESRGWERSSAFTFDEVAPGLYQGDFPEGEVDWSRFDDVVSMSSAAPDPPPLAPDGLWLHVPIWDGEMEQPELVRDTARTVADRVLAGRRVLVHCWAGLNRSGVVAARALMFMGVPVSRAIEAVRAARGPDALFNGHFVAWLHQESRDAARAGGRRGIGRRRGRR